MADRDPWLLLDGAIVLRGDEAAVVADLVDEALRVRAARGASANLRRHAQMLARLRELAAIHRRQTAARFADAPADDTDRAGAASSVYEQISTDAAAAVLGVTAAHVRRMCRDGRLDARQVAGRWLVDVGSVADRVG